LSLDLSYKSILVKIITYVGFFICIYSGVVFIILAVHAPNIPNIYSHLAWVSDSHTIYLNLLIIGLGILIGSLIYNKYLPTHDSSGQIRNHIIKLNIKKVKILCGTISFSGIFIASVMSGYFISLMIFIFIYYTNSVEFAELFLMKFMITYFFLLFGLFIFYIGYFIIKNHLPIQKTKKRTTIPKFLKKRYKILSTIISVYSAIIFYIFRSAIFAIFIYNNYYFTGDYPPPRFDHELMGFLLTIVTTSLLIHSLTITYFVRTLKFEKKSLYLKRLQPTFNLAFISRIGSILLIISFIISLQAYFSYVTIGFLFNIIYLIIYPWIFRPWGYSEYLIISLFFIHIFLIACIIILIPRRKYEVLKDI
jgi:hypothetical protein